MPLNIKNADVERLAEEVSRLAGESKTEAIRRALIERRARLRFALSGNNRATRLRYFLERDVWPSIPKKELGRKMSRTEEESILGYGETGV